jgi:hypothetical protein
MQHESLFFLLPAIALTGVWISAQLGHFAGGQFAALPTIAGPTSFLLATQIGPNAAITAAIATLVGGIAVEAMFVLYSRLLAKDVNILRTTLLSLAVYLLLSILVTGLNWKSTAQSLNSAQQLLLCVTIVLLTTLMSARLAKSSHTILAAPCNHGDSAPANRTVSCNSIRSKKFGIALIVSLTISFLTFGALANLGPFAAGLVIGFPVISYCGMVLSQAVDGRPAAQNFIRGRCVGRMSYQAFFLTVIVLLPHINVVAAYGAAVLVCVFVQQSAAQVKRKLAQGLVA